MRSLEAGMRVRTADTVMQQLELLHHKTFLFETSITIEGKINRKQIVATVIKRNRDEINFNG